MRNVKPFNITLLQPPGMIHSLALKEAADYIHATVGACGYQTLRTINRVFGDAYNIVFCAHLLSSKQIRRIPDDAIIFNSESLEDADEKAFYSDAYGEALERFFVWDYSYRNLPFIPHDRKTVIPFLNCNALRREGMARAKGSELLFYGRVTPRRQSILQNLERNGVRIKVLSGVYEDARDLHMRCAWAVLNLHKHDDTLTFEPIRCFYPLINEVPVVSEDADDASAEPFRNTVFFLRRESLIDDLTALYFDQSSFDQRSRDMLAEFRSKDPVPAAAAAIDQYLAHCRCRS